MEPPEPAHPTPSTRDQPAPAPGIPGGPGTQASPRLTLGPVILPPEQGLPPTLFLKALPVPLYHTVPPGGFQPRAPLVTGSLEGASVPFILSPLLQPEGPSPSQVGKPATPALTVNIVGTLPVLSPGVGSTLVNPGRLKNAGKHLCPHCGRDCLKPSVLEKHIRSHTGERPFPCSTCGIAFKTQSNLYKHRRTQTHLNNSRVSSESEGSGSSLLEEGDRPGETASVESRGEERAPEGALSPGARSPLAAKNRERKVESAPSLVAALSHGEASVDQTQSVSPEFSLASPQPRRKLPEPKPCPLQRQQETCSEKPWDPKALEGQLRKCESTDSGYLSRSDSVEQPPVASSPLHSLSEHSAESEGEGGPGCDSASNRAEPAASGASLEMEKKKLEERIAQLISHNQAVVDDPQLDHVRPRKTVLSKQGSIDLPMPYTYKDSFHFDIRALEPTRRRIALSPACSTFTPLEKARPIFFHSVPTQLSTTVECVPVTRSNSMPFIEASKLQPEPQGPQDTVPRMQKALSPRLTPARPGCRPGLTLAGIPSGHPRALVRQAAVEDLPCTPTGDPSTMAEDLDGKRAGVQEGAACKGRAGKKCSQRKQKKMFSQEKWQVYGNETFKRIYQKMKNSNQEGQKPREVKQGQGTELDLSSQVVAGSESAALSQDNRVPMLGATTAGAEPGSWGSRPSLEDSLEAEPPKQLKVVARAKSSPTLGSTDGLCVSCKSPLLSSSQELDLGCQPPTVSEPHQGGDLEAPETALPDPSGEAIQETSPGAQGALRRSSGGSVAPQITEDKLPSERKRPKVEGLHRREQPGPVEAETPGSSVQADPQPPQKQDIDPEKVLGSSNESILHVTTAPESSDASSAISTVALKWPGLGDKDSPLPSVPGTPGLHPLLPAQPWDPSVPAALSGGFFAPRYLLRLPQGENPLPPVAPGPGKGRDSLCTNAQPAEQALLVGSELGVLRPPGAYSCPGEAGGSPEDSSGSRSRDGREEAQMGREKRRGSSSIPVAEHSPGPSSGTIQEIASILPTHTCDTHVAQDVVSETHATHCLRTDSLPARTRTHGNLSNPWTSSQKLGTPPKNALEGPPLETKGGLPACFLSQAPCLLTSFTRSQGISLNQQKLGLSHLLGSPRNCETTNSFPSLKAEPQLTWCCLGRGLPLPAEQQKAPPGHMASGLPDGSLQGESDRALARSSGGKTKINPGRERPTQAPELPYPIVPGMRVQDQVSSTQWKKGLCSRKVKPSRENTKQKKMMLHSKRCEGSFWQRAKRLCKPHWLPRRSCLPHRLVGLEPRGTLERTSGGVAGLNLQGEPSCASTDLSIGHRSREKESDCRQTSDPISAGTSPIAILEIDKSALKDISPPAGERDEPSQEKERADGSGLSLQSHVHLEGFQEDLLPQDKALDAGPPRTRLLPSQDQVSMVPNLCTSPDISEPPSSFRSKGTLPHHDTATSVAAVCVSVGIRTGHKTLGAHSAESYAEETLTQSSPGREATPDSIPQVLLPGRPSPGQRSPGKTNVDMPHSGPCSVSSRQEEGRSQAAFPSWGQYGCGEMATHCAALGSESGACQGEELNTPKSATAPSGQRQPSEVSEAPLRSLRKRSLEGMRKQTRVELSDVSSDDEDRLVIEI